MLWNFVVAARSAARLGPLLLLLVAATAVVPVTSTATTAAPAPSATAAAPRRPRLMRSLRRMTMSGPLLDLEDLVRDETVGLAVDSGGGVGGRGLDQAEDLARALVHPV